MHLIHIPEGISEPIPVAGGREMLSGQSYIASNAFTGFMLQSRWRVMIDEEVWALNQLLEAYPFLEEFEFGFDLNKWEGGTIWLARGGGWGDLLMLTPLIMKLKEAQPNCEIHVACGEQYHPVFDGLGVIPELLPVPISEQDHLITFEGTVEGHPAAEKIHLAQLFANVLGIDLEKKYKPTYIVSDTERLTAVTDYPRTNRKRVGIQYMASCLMRSYPMINQVVDALLDRNIEVFLFGQAGQVKLEKNAHPDLINLTDRNHSFRQSAAVLETCDCVIAPDSVMVHLASALDVPCVALYGPFSASLRVSSDKVAVLEGRAPCAPCFYHAAYPMDFPNGMPCKVAGKCIAMADIKVEQIVEQAINLCSPIIQI